MNLQTIKQKKIANEIRFNEDKQFLIIEIRREYLALAQKFKEFASICKSKTEKNECVFFGIDNPRCNLTVCPFVARR